MIILRTVGLLGRVTSSSQGLCLNTGQHKHKINTYTHQTPMFCVGFESTIPTSERGKTVHALGRPHTNCVKTSIKTWDKRDKSWREHHDSDRCALVFIISFVSTVILSLRHVADIVSWLLHVLTHAGVRPTLERSATVTGFKVDYVKEFKRRIQHRPT
jgi:hypothetical protein